MTVSAAGPSEPSGMPVGDLPARGELSVDLSVPAVALAIGAHPDDVEFGCGATLAKWAAAGCRIHHLVLTDGSKGTWEATGDTGELIATRRREQLDAARALGGGEVTFLDYVDGELASGLDERRSVCRVIREVRPDVVLGHDPWRRYRIHPDHRHAGWLVTDGVVAARDPKFFPDVGPGPHRPSTLLLWEADEPNHVEDAATTARVKLAALLAHASQYRSTMDIEDDTTRSDTDTTAAFGRRLERQLAAHGALAGLAHGEAFHRIAPL
ncbi:MAG TPA: PIG-L deacetylase family protein [Acidimicrobiales bacterium]|nr:PIG-L deacetylase family protein [Acidimicrobiales bacterium]